MRSQEKNEQRKEDRRKPVAIPIDGKLTARIAGIAVALYFFGSQIVEIRNDQKIMNGIINQILVKQTEQAKDIEFIKERQRDVEKRNNNGKQRGKDE